MTKPSQFRGYWSIKEVIDELTPLAEFYRSNKPGIKTLTLRRQDYDLIARWPQAAGMFKVTARDDGIYYEEFKLAFDKKPPRYAEKGARA